MTAPHTCAGQVWKGYRYHSCGNTGAHEHEGAMYCKTHHPPTVQAKREKKHTELVSKVEGMFDAQKAAAAAAAEMKRRAECFPDLLEALQAAVVCGMVPISSVSEGGASKHSRQVQVADMIRAAIQKATKEQV